VRRSWTRGYVTTMTRTTRTRTTQFSGERDKEEGNQRGLVLPSAEQNDDVCGMEPLYILLMQFAIIYSGRQWKLFYFFA